MVVGDGGTVPRWAKMTDPKASIVNPARLLSRPLAQPAARSVASLLSALLLTAAASVAQAPAAEPRAEDADVRAQADRPPLPPPGEMARCKRLIDSGMHNAARARLKPIVEQHPEWARAIALLGLSYYREDRFEVAAGLFARALAADPEEIAARPLYGWSLYSLGRPEEAQKMFESLLERKPGYTAAQYALGVIHLERDETDAARQHLEATVRLAREQQDPPMEGRARARLGDLHVRLDDLEAARRELEAALTLLPDEAEALFKLSRVLQRLGDAEGAQDARRRYEAAKESTAAVGMARRPGRARAPFVA